MSVLLHGSSEIITSKDQLVHSFARKPKTRAQWLVGVEHEKFPYRLGSLVPPSYEEPNGMRDFMRGMTEYGWEPVMEGANIIGLTRGKAAISFEPGGQIELAGAPLVTLHETQHELAQHLREANAVAEKLGIGFAGIGFHPTARRDDIPWVPKGRYKIMRAYMPKRGGKGLDMMVRTCTVQVNLDFSDEADMVRKFRVALAVQPFITALFASSPYVEGKASGLSSSRMAVWEDTDPDRCGAPEFAYDKNFGFERYTDYALDVPMYFVYRNGQYIDCAGQSFRDFMQGRLPALPGEMPTLSDWSNHLTTLFPDVRLKNIIEMRGADAGSAPMLQALPAIWTGLLYDDASLDAAWDIARGWSAEQRRALRRDVIRDGLHTRIGNQTAQEIAQKLVALSADGLKRRGHMQNGQDESIYVSPLAAIAASGENQSDILLKKFGPSFLAEAVFDACRL